MQHAISGKFYEGELGGIGVPEGNSPLQDVESALKSARELALRIRAIAANALGDVPEGCAGTDRKDPTGTITLLAARASDVSTEIGEAMRACSRLESALRA